MDILLASDDLYSNKRTSIRLKFFLNTDLRPVYITNKSQTTKLFGCFTHDGVSHFIKWLKALRGSRFQKLCC